MGYTENPLFSINSALLRNYSDSTEKAYQYFSQKDFIEWHKKHGLESTCQDYGVYRRIHAAIKQGKPLSFRSTFCSAQTGGFVFDPFGRIYTCWETVNQKEHCIGNYSLNNDIVWNEQVEERWRKTYLWRMLYAQAVNTHYCVAVDVRHKTYRNIVVRIWRI